MRTHAIVRTHTRPMRERGAAGAIFSDRGRVLVLIFAFLLIYREPASWADPRRHEQCNFIFCA